MKKRYFVCFMLLLMFLLTACSGGEKEDDDRTSKYDMYEDVVLEDVRAKSELNTQYVITDGAWNGEADDPMIKRIGSQEELNAYCEKYGELFDLGDVRTGYYGDKSISFMEACERFDEAFWAENELLLAAFSDNVINRHAVVGIEKQVEGRWILNVTCLSSIMQVGMSEYWHLLIELPRGTVPAEDEILLWIKSEQVKEIICTTGEAPIGAE